MQQAPQRHQQRLSAPRHNEQARSYRGAAPAVQGAFHCGAIRATLRLFAFRLEPHEMSAFDSDSNGSDPFEPTQIAHRPVNARVPEKISRGAMSTGFLVSFGQHEFVLDFLQMMVRPPQLAGRVVLSPAVAAQFSATLKENLGRYEAAFGKPPAMPKPGPNERPRTPQEIYEDLKLTDDMLSGVYANAVMVGHTPAEFSLDFITSFFPTAAVTARIYLAAPRVPQLIDTLDQLIQQYNKTHPPEPPPASFP
jgi:hypothetical protein